MYIFSYKIDLSNSESNLLSFYFFLSLNRPICITSFV